MHLVIKEQFDGSKGYVQLDYVVSVTSWLLSLPRQKWLVFKTESPKITYGYGGIQILFLFIYLFIYLFILFYLIFFYPFIAHLYLYLLLHLKIWLYYYPEK